MIVTGAAFGPGAECARQFADEGAKLVLLDLNADALAATAARIATPVVTVVGDVSLAATAER